MLSKAKLLQTTSMKFTFLIAVTVVFGYLLFRLVLKESDQPITFELFAALIGFSLTILTTSLLLHRQTEAELSKEENVLFLNLKMKVYLELIDQLQDVIMKRRITDEDILELRLLNQKIAFIASPEVLQAFNKFVRYFSELAEKESEIKPGEIDNLMDELSTLSVYIREDLFNRSDQILDTEEIRKLVISSNEELDLED
jgi:hypothetical protein